MILTSVALGWVCISCQGPEYSCYQNDGRLLSLVPFECEFFCRIVTAIRKNTPPDRSRTPPELASERRSSFRTTTALLL